MELLNWELIKQPVNWFVLFFMVLIAFILWHMIMLWETSQ